MILRFIYCTLLSQLFLSQAQAQFVYQKHSHIQSAKPVRLDFRQLPADWGIGMLQEAPLPGSPLTISQIDNRKQQLSIKKTLRSCLKHINYQSPPFHNRF